MNKIFGNNFIDIFFGEVFLLFVSILLWIGIYIIIALLFIIIALLFIILIDFLLILLEKQG